MVRRIRMGRIFPVLLLSMLVSGCALPVPVQVASWALDGISYLATNKSMTDHGISAVVGQDCALLRAVNGTDICVEGDHIGTVIVDADTAIESPSTTVVASLVPRRGVTAFAVSKQTGPAFDTPVAAKSEGKRLNLRDPTIKQEVFNANLGLFSIRPPTGLIADVPTDPLDVDQIAEFETAAGEPMMEAEAPIGVPEGAGLMQAWSGAAASQMVALSATVTGEDEFLPFPSRKPVFVTEVVAAGHITLPEGPGLIALWQDDVGGPDVAQLMETPTVAVFVVAAGDIVSSWQVRVETSKLDVEHRAAPQMHDLVAFAHGTLARLDE